MNVDTLIRDALEDAVVDIAPLATDRAVVSRRAGRLRRRRAVARIGSMLVLLLAVVSLTGVAVAHRDAGEGRTDVAVPAPAPTASLDDPSPAGDDAWLMPPTDINGLALQAVRLGGLDPQPQAIVQQVRLGNLAFSAEQGPPEYRSITYYFDANAEPWATQGSPTDPAVRITTASNTTIQPSSVLRLDLTLKPAPQTSASGIMFVDAGVQCAPAGGKQLFGWVLVTFSSCRHLIIGWSGGLAFAIDAAPDANIDGVVDDLGVTTLANLQQQLAGVAGVSRLATDLDVARTPRSAPTTTYADTPFCSSWRTVMDLAANHAPGDPALLNAMEEAAQLASPEMATDLRHLGEIWSGAGSSTDDSAAVMQRVINTAAAECGNARSAESSTTAPG